jgi:hypothetical protein
MPLPEALLHGLRVSYTDAEVLLALPGVLARHGRDLDWTDLRERARRMKLKAELGLLLELAAEVAGMPALAGEAGGLRDRRRSVPRCLPEERSGYERRLADERTPEVARRWGFRMNLTLEAFRSAFDGGAAPATGREAAVAPTGHLELLRAIDAELPGPARVAVVGESALALGTGSIDDVPTLEIAAVDFRDFWEAAERAGTRRGTGPALRPARDLRAPFAWRDRLSPADLPGLTRLHVLLPERHDLALLLAGGGLASGLQLAEELHRRQPLRPGILLARHHEADDGRIENDGAFVLGFLALAHRLFGAELAGRLEAHLEGGAPAPDVA